MFSVLNQGSLVYILDKTTTPKYLIGEVVGVSQPKFQGYQSSIDMKIKVEGEVKDYGNIPSNLSLVSYNNGKVIISETKLGLLNEVEGLLLSSKQIIDNIDTYKLNIIDCEAILKQLNPLFAKDKERDERLNTLETKFAGVESKIDLLITLILK